MAETPDVSTAADIAKITGLSEPEVAFLAKTSGQDPSKIYGDPNSWASHFLSSAKTLSYTATQQGKSPGDAAWRAGAYPSVYGYDKEGKFVGDLPGGKKVSDRDSWQTEAAPAAQQTATGGSSTGLIASNAPTLTQNYDTSPSKNTPTEMAKMGGFTLPEGWDKYTPDQKIAFYNSNSIGGNTLLKAGVQQWELDWMRKNGYNAPDTFTPPVTPGGLIGTASATKQTNPYALSMTGLVNQGKSTTLADNITGNSNPGSKITSASQQLTAPLAATATLPNGAVAKTTGGMGYSTGNASTTPGVENWYNALTGQSRVVVPGGFTPPDANWKKA